MVRCYDIMTKELVVCLASEPVAVVAKKMEEADVGALPVVEDARSRVLIGIITDRDLALRVIGEQLDPDTTQAGHVMSSGIITCDPDDGIGLVMKKMSDTQVRRVPVVDRNGELVGIIAQADIATRVQQPNETAEVVEEISKPTNGRW